MDRHPIIVMAPIYKDLQSVLDSNLTADFSQYSTPPAVCFPIAWQ
jgi:hypothetical protein